MFRKSFENNVMSTTSYMFDSAKYLVHKARYWALTVMHTRLRIMFKRVGGNRNVKVFKFKQHGCFSCQFKFKIFAMK